MSSFLAALPAFIASLPAFFQLLAKFMSMVERLVNLAEKNNLSHWLDDLEAQIDLLEKAETPDEKRAAARGLSNSLRGLD